MPSQKDVQFKHEQRNSPAPTQTISGKLVIITIATLAVLGAGSSWWFRYSATHRAARFWGPEASFLIRDAPLVTWLHLHEGISPVNNPDGDWVSANLFSGRVGSKRDISKARGLIHLRTALIEDANYDWTPRIAPPEFVWRYGLRFQRDAQSPPLDLYFSPDCQLMYVNFNGSGRDGQPNCISCAPIAGGLTEMFAEFNML